MSKKQFTYELQNVANGSAEIQIYGYIGKWEEVDYPSFQKAFRDALAKNKELTIRIHSGGGSVYEGLAIYDLIRSSEAIVNVIVEGMAASMASVIALAGDTVQMTENAFFMMHAVTGSVWGNKNDLTNYVEQIENCEKRLQAIYKERTTADEKTIKNWFDSGQDHWLDADACLQLSICDEVVKPTKNKQIDNKTIINKTPEQAWENIAASFTGKTPKTAKTMNKATMLAAFSAYGLAGNITASSTDEDLKEHLENVLKKAKKADSLQNELNAFKQQEVDKVKTKINQAVATGKIVGSEKAQWEQDAEDNPAMVERMLDKLPGKPNPNNSLNREKPQVDGDQHELFNARETWTFSQWQDKDPEGLARIQGEAPEQFDELFNKRNK